MYYIPSISSKKNVNNYINNKIYERDKIIITHSPSNLNKKGTIFIREAIKLLKEEYNIEYKELHNMTNNEVLKEKSNSTLFIDQCFVGWYGKSLIESIQYGTPSLCYISPNGKNKYLDHFKDINFPIIEIYPNAFDIFNKIKDIIDHNKLFDLSIQTFEYYNKIHYDKCFIKQSNLYKLCYNIKDYNTIKKNINSIKTFTNESIINNDNKIYKNNISILTLGNYAGSAGNYAEALTDKQNIKCFSLRKENIYKYTNFINFYFNINENISFIKNSNIIHLKGDFYIEDYECIFEILKHKLDKKQLYITFDSSIMRENIKNFPLVSNKNDVNLWIKPKKNYEEIYINYIKYSLFFKYCPKNNYLHEKIVSNSKSKLYKKSIITACLLPKLEDIVEYKFIPHTYSINYNLNFEFEQILITHSPSCNITKKGTIFIEKAIQLLQKKYNIKYIRLQNMLNEEVLFYKKKSTLFIDQCIIGWYGNSLVEALSYGIPCCTYMSNYGLEIFKRNYPTIEMPIINILPNSIDIYNKIESFIINNQYKDLKIKSINYFNNVHSYNSSSKLLNYFYSN